MAGQEVNFIMPARGVEHFVFVPSQDARQKGLMNKVCVLRRGLVVLLV